MSLSKRRAYFLVATLLGLFLATGLIVTSCRSMSDQNDGVQARWLEARGAEVRRHSSTPGLSQQIDSDVFTFGKIWKVRFTRSTITTQDIDVLLALTELRSAEFSRCAISDPDVMCRLAKLHQITSLDITFATIPEGAKFEAGDLKSLQHLNVSSSTFSPSFLASIRHLSQLRSLGLIDCEVKQEDVATLRRHILGINVVGPKP